MRRPWTAADRRRLRRWYPAKPVGWICRRLGRSLLAVHGMAKKLGVRSGRYWPADKVRLLKRLYGTMPGPRLAKRLGVGLKRLHNAAKKYGVARDKFAWTPEAERRLRALNAKGWSDTEIAAELGCDRHAVSKRREKLGLPCWYGVKGAPWHEHKRAQVRRRTAEQLRAAGVPTLGQLRAESYRKFARENGWPGDLRPRAVMILNALAARGPMTRRQIVEAIGMEWHGSRRSLKSNDPEGSYLGHLQARGLVCYLHRSQPSGRQGGGRIPGLYMLTLQAMEMIRRRVDGKAG